MQEIEDQIDIDDAWKAKNEPGEPIPWEELKKELEGAGIDVEIIRLDKKTGDIQATSDLLDRIKKGGPF